MEHRHHDNDLYNELKSLQSTLLKTKKSFDEEIPANYFDELYSQIINKKDKDYPQISKHKVFALRYQLIAAASLALLFCSTLWMTNWSNNYVEATLDEEIISYLQTENSLDHMNLLELNIDMSNFDNSLLVQEEIEDYLLNHIDELDLEYIIDK